jgi:hypothetical protein
MEKIGGASSKNWRDEKCVQYFVQNPEGKRPLGKSSYRWEGNIKSDLKEIRW